MMDFLKGTVTPKDWIAVGVILGVIVIVVVVFVVVIHKGQTDTLAALTAENDQVLEDLRLAREKEAKFNDLRSEMNDIETLIGDFGNRLPDTREIATLTQQFEALAGEVGIQMKLTSEPRIKDERKETIPFSIVAHGNFHQIASFINRLERFERYLKVTDLKIGEQEQGVAEAEFTLSTYRFLEATAEDAAS